MTEQPGDLEARLAQERLDRLVAEFRRARQKSVRLIIVFLVLAIVLVLFQLPLLAFASLLALCICVLRYFDVNGRIHDVLRHPATTLFTRLPLNVNQGAIRTATEPEAR